MIATSYARLGTLLLLTAAGCQSRNAEYTQTAQEDFTRAYSCPKERVTATPRPDLSAYDLAVGPNKPPPDVAADPGRLAEWKKQQADVAAGYRGEVVIQVSGCGHEAYDLCSLGHGSNGQIVPACSTAQYPPK